MPEKIIFSLNLPLNPPTVSPVKQSNRQKGIRPKVKTMETTR